jgi:hypothetical protein
MASRVRGRTGFHTLHISSKKHMTEETIPTQTIATGSAAIVMGVGHYTDALTAAPQGRSAEPATNGRSGGSLDRASNTSIAHPVSRASVNV